MIKTVIVGLGPHGSRIVEASKLVQELDLVAIVDMKTEVMASFPTLKHYTDYEEMLAVEKPSCVIVATNGPSHYALAMKAIEAGVKYLMISKPLTCKLSEAIQLLDEAKKNNVKVAVDHGLRYDSTYEYICDYIQEGNLGELLHIYIMRNGIGLGCLGVHSFDLANSLFHSFPSSVTAWVDQSIGKNPRGSQFVDPGGTVIMSYPKGGRAIVEQKEGAVGSFFTDIHGTKGKIQLDSKTGTVTGKIVTEDGIKDFELPSGIQLKHDTITLMSRVLNSLVSDETLKADGEMGLRSVEILAGAYKSSDEGHVPVALPIEDQNTLDRFLPVT